MSVKSAIKKILPVSLIEKRQRWKTNRALQHEGKREFRNFAQSYALLNVQIRFRWRAY